MKKKNLMRRLSFMLMAAALPLVGMAQRVSLPYGYAARGGMSYCPNTYLPGWMAGEPEQPVQDATFFIANPSFEEGGAEHWSGDISNSDIRVEGDHHFAYKSSDKFDVWQEFVDIPNGVYELSVHGFYEGDKSPRRACMYAGMETYALKSKSEGNGDLWSNYYSRKVRAIVTNHKLRIGVKGIYDGCSTSFDDFSLQYLGNSVAGFAATFEDDYDIVHAPIWTIGEFVAVHAGGEVYEYKAVSSGSQTTLVAAENRFPQSGLEYIAVRPYNEDDATNNTLTLHETQSYVEDGIDISANPMAAIINTGNELSFDFKSVCGLLQLNLTGNSVNVNTITVQAKNGEKLCGTGSLSFIDGNPKWECTEGSVEVSLVVPDEETVSLGETATPFYIALPPANYSGLTVTVTDGTANTCELQFDNVEIVRSAVTTREETVVYRSLKVPASLALGMDKDDYKIKTLIADVVPSNSTVEWSCIPTGVVELSPTTGNYITVTAMGASTATITAKIQGTSISATCVVDVAPAGAIPGQFTVSTDKRVYFSKGNMYWDGNSSSYKFEAKQYDYRMHHSHGGQEAVINGVKQETPTNTVGSFLWVNNTQDTPNPYDWNVTVPDGATSDVLFTNDEATTPNANFTVNGQTGVWRALSGNDGEWNYLLNTRETKYTDSDGNIVEDRRYAEVKVNDVWGMLVFPDKFSWPEGVGNEPTIFNTCHSSWNEVNYTTEQFAVLETAGCVFLPCAGYRKETSVGDVGTDGYYWSSTAYDATQACNLGFDSGGVGPAGYDIRCGGFSVRLVCIPVPATGVTLDNDNMVIGKTGDVNEVKWLRATLSPSNSTDAVTWKSDDESIATVDNTGKVTSVAAGTTVITATTTSGKTANCTVNVVELKEFSVSADTPPVHFATGNLWYDKSPDNDGPYWGFEAHQYDFRTYPNKGSMLGGAYNTGSGTPADTYGLFGWGDAPANGDDIKTSTTDSDYIWPDGGTDPWGSKIGEGWRTLTSNEWKYLLNSRNTSWTRFAKATVMGVPGLIVFPDGITGTTIGGVTINNANAATNVVFTVNTIDASNWSSMEDAGCVFLPCAGYRENSEVTFVYDGRGDYWSSTPHISEASCAHVLIFRYNSVRPDTYGNRYYGRSVRLVH